MDKENRQARDVNIYIIAVIIPFLVTMVAWPLYNLIVGGLFGFKTLDANEFGDAFGVANSVISALAFAAIYIAIRLQKRDIDLQYEALQQSIAEMKLTAESTQNLSKSQDLANRLTLYSLQKDIAATFRELRTAKTSSPFNVDNEIDFFRVYRRKEEVDRLLAKLDGRYLLIDDANWSRLWELIEDYYLESVLHNDAEGVRTGAKQIADFCKSSFGEKAALIDEFADKPYDSDYPRQFNAALVQFLKLTL